CFLRKLSIIAGQGLSRFLALEVREVLDRVILVVDDQNDFRNDIGIGEVELLLAFFGNAYLIDNGVIAFSIKTCDEAVPFAFNKLRLYAEFGGDCFTDFHVETNKLVVLVVIGEWSIGAFSPNFQNTGRLDGIEIFSSQSASEENGLNDACGSENLSEFHSGIRDLVDCLLIAEI